MEGYPGSSHLMKPYRSFTLLLFVGALFADAAPLRVDINSEGRSDMRTVGWENWKPSDDNWSQTFGDVTVTLRASSDDGSLSLKGSKAIVIYGVTLGADGAIVSGGKPAEIEIQLEGLTPGLHTFVGYHHELGEYPGTYTIAANDGGKIKGFEPSTEARHNDEVGTTYISFEAKANRPSVIRIAPHRGDRVVLSGFAIDVSDPRKKALKPLPVDLERHADGDNGKVQLAWSPSSSAVAHDVYVVSDVDPDAAERKLIDATKLTTIKGSAYAAAIAPNNSLLHYAWRIDSVDASGNVTPGMSGTFESVISPFQRLKAMGVSRLADVVGV